ncbi:MAG: PAS domain S-box protein [Bacteroidota bacterium]
MDLLKKVRQQKSVLTAVVAFLLLLVISQYLVYQQYLMNKDTLHEQMQHESNAVKERLQTNLGYAESAAHTLAFIVKEYGVPVNFNEVAKDLIANGTYIDALELTNQGIITHVYPLRGNESIIGFNILSDSVRGLEAVKALQRRKMHFAGPFELKQGGIGVVGRVPIFRQNEFQGFAMVLIKLPTLLRAAGLNFTDSEFQYQLSKNNPITGKEEFFMPSDFDFSRSHYASVEVPDGEWKLYVALKNERALSFDILALSILGLLLSLTGGTLVFQWARQRDWLRNRVEAVDYQLQLNEQSYRSLFDHNPDAVFSFDFEGRFVSANESLLHMVECSRLEVMGTTFERFLAPEDRERVLLLFQNAVNGETQNYNTGIVTRTGKRKVVNVTKLPIIIQGELRGVFGIAKDITAEMRAREELMASEEKYKSLFSNSPVSKWIYDLDSFRILEVNESATALHGYSREEFLNMTLSDLHPREDVSAFLEMNRSQIKGGTVRYGKWRHVKKNGEVVHMEMAGHTMVFNGQPAMMMVGVDITEKVLAEEKLRWSHERLLKLTHKVPAVIYEFEMSPEGVMRFPFVSKGIESLWPHLDANEMVKGPVTSFSTVHPDDYDRFLASILESREKLSEWNIEYRTVDASGIAKWIQGSSRPEKSPDGTVTWYGYLQDITPQKQAEQTLRELNATLKEKAEALTASNQELERFAYVASHDLQEPLRMVSSFLQLLRLKYDAVLDDQARQYIRFAVDGAERMKQLILDLLAFSRLGTGDQKAEEVDLNDTVRDTLKVFEADIEAHGATCTLGRLPVVKGVRTQLSQLFQNLVGNALKYRHAERPPAIAIGCQDKGHQWYFEISDNGIGIEERFYEKIFVIFQRLHSKEDYRGTGIGLSICKKIVERHGGTMGVRSEPGKGSTFYFTMAK